MQQAGLPFYLSLKEMWRNRGRFLLVSLVIALITLLVLFIAALGEGLGNGNREYLARLNAQLIVYQSNSDFIIGASRLSRDRVASVRRVPGVADAGPLGTASATLVLPGGAAPLKVALLGVEPGRVGEPPVVQGRQLGALQADEVILDNNVALRSHLKVGDELTIRVTQGTDDKNYHLRVVGLAAGQQYGLQPSIFVPFITWDRVRPKSAAEVDSSTAVANVILVRLTDPAQLANVRQLLLARLNKVDVATIPQSIDALPGYTAQQSTLNTQGAFTLLIGVLVIGGFFQIQALQKVPQIGVLKAIGSSNLTVAVASVSQIMLVTAIGVGLGGLSTYLLSLSFPPTIPIVFNGQNSALAVLALLAIGPLGGLVSVRYAVRIEPLRALGLSS
jgi:putative ABC transport system permease protein